MWFSVSPNLVSHCQVLLSKAWLGPQIGLLVCLQPMRQFGNIVHVHLTLKHIRWQPSNSNSWETFWWIQKLCEVLCLQSASIPGCSHGKEMYVGSTLLVHGLTQWCLVSCDSQCLKCYSIAESYSTGHKRLFTWHMKRKSDYSCTVILCFLHNTK